MKFVAIEGNAPAKRRDPHRLEHYLKEFMKMNIKVARVDFDENEYSTIKTAYTSIRKAAERFVLPIDVATRNGELYLIRRDI